MSALTQVGVAAVDPLVHIWNNIVAYLPGLIGAILVSIVGYLIALIIGNLVKHSLVKAKLDKWVEKKNLKSALLNIELSKLVGHLVHWGVFIAFLAPAAGLIKLDQLSFLIRSFALWIPSLILGVIIVAVGVILATLASRSVFSKDNKTSKLISHIIRIAIIIIFLDIALNQIGVQLQFVEMLFLVIVGAILLTMAIVTGIGFGSAIKDHAQDMVDDYFEKKKKK